MKLKLKLPRLKRFKPEFFDYRALLALIIFLASAAIPIGIYYLLVERSSHPEQDLDRVFPQSVQIRSRGTFIKVSNHEKLNPITGNDFILVSWFKIAEPPVEDQDMVLLSKVDPQKRTPNGYSLRLIRVGADVRPQVFWHDVEGKGSKYDFSEIRVDPDSWYGFVLSYNEPNLLGLHVIQISSDLKTNRSLLGGYRLSVPVFPSPTTDLLVGAGRFGTFRGSLGPVAVIQGPKVADKINDVVKEISRNPLDIQSIFSKKYISFFTVNTKEDRGPLKLTIHTSDNLSNKVDTTNQE